MNMKIEHTQQDLHLLITIFQLSCTLPRLFDKAHNTLLSAAIMPKGKRWSSEENLDLAQAWIEVSKDVGSEEDVMGTNQDFNKFWNHVHQCFTVKGGSTGKGKGIYGDQALTAIQNQWKENISRNIKNFN
jgi:hypothetical protein